MTKLSTLVIALCLLTLSPVVAQTTISKEERASAVKHLKETQSALMKELKGLSEAQLNYKSTEEAWSIAECVEHLAISETNIFGIVQMTLKEDPDPSRRSEVKFDDAGIVGLIVDRSTKVKTRKPFEPTGKFGSYDGSVDEFKAKRKDNMKYVKSTQDDLRNRYFEFPFGVVDSYQVIRFMAGHTTRHTSQIKEIKESQGYPAS